MARARTVSNQYFKVEQDGDSLIPLSIVYSLVRMQSVSSFVVRRSRVIMGFS